jgi:hypothetical protein
VATLTIQLDKGGQQVSYTSPTITDANMDRFIDYLWDAFPPLDGNNDPLPRNTANEAAAYQLWAAEQWKRLKSKVKHYEYILARDSVPDMES